MTARNLFAIGLLLALAQPVFGADRGDERASQRARGLSDGVEGLIKQISDREVELTRRQRDLDDRERSIAELEARVEKSVGELERVQAEIERRIETWLVKDGDRVTQLSKVYSVMPPVKAARLLEKLDLDLSVKIVQKMKKKQSAALLSEMRSERALVISRRLVEPLNPGLDEAKRGRR